MRKNTSLSRKITFSVAFILFVLYCAFILFFFVFAFAIATKTDMKTFTADQIAGKLFSFSVPLNLKNFVLAFSEWDDISEYGGYATMIWNSVWRTVGYVVISQLSTAMVCYILCFYKNKFTKVIYNLGLFLTILPLYGAAGAQYKLYSDLGLINNPLILYADITLYGSWFFFMYAFWKSIAWEYAEAAFVDGANHYMVFFRIMLPMFIPGMMALSVMSFIGTWNGYESTLLYMDQYPNLAYGIYAYSEISKYKANTPAYFAGVLIALLPALILFAIFQNSIMEKVYLGGLKG